MDWTQPLRDNFGSRFVVSALQLPGYEGDADGGAGFRDKNHGLGDSEGEFAQIMADVNVMA